MALTTGNPLEELSLDQLRQRTSMKWRTHPDDVLPLWVAEMDVPLAPPVHEALTSALDRGDTGYPVGTAYAEALAGFASQRWGWDGVAVERTAIVPDVMLGIVEVLHLLTAPGDTVVVNCPVYPPFYAFLETAGRSVREVPLGQHGRLDLDALAEAFGSPVDGRRPAAFLLCSPHNPTGVVHTAEELAAVAELGRRHGVRVVADEIHAPLVLPGASFVPFLSVPGAENGFSVLSATKGWNLAGLKAALVVAGPDAAGDLARCLRSSATARATSGSWRTRPPCAAEATGSTRCSPGWTTTAGCSPSCSPSTCRPCRGSRRPPPTSPGWTAAGWASTTTGQPPSRHAAW
jgi:cystathionine beta-lyase